MAFKFVLFAAFVAIAQAGNLALAPAPAFHAVPALARVATPVYTQHLAPAPLVHAAPVAKLVPQVLPIAKTVVDTEYDPNPQYSYAYDIQDALTGDSKNHYETRNGDVVQGSYSLVDPDGTRRTVEYTADAINGFNAVVHREPLVKAVAAAPIVAKVAAPIAYSAPVAYAAPVAKFAAPLTYAAPVTKFAAPIAYAQPIAHYAQAPIAVGKTIIH